jgi:endoglucanase
LVGETLDTEWAQRPGSYTIQSDDDPAYAAGVSPMAVHRKTKPTDMAQTSVWSFAFPLRHYLYLRLPEPLAEGATYHVQLDEGPLPALDYTHDPGLARSEAVHVSQLGFRPSDPAKVAFLSCWMGDGGPLDYPAGLAFRVLHDESGEAVYEGTLSLAKAKGEATEDAYAKNYNGTDVWEADFSQASLRPGTSYRVSVDGIGCSYPFRCDREVWDEALQVSAKVYYYQRSGIALEPPHSEMTRPRTFHPDDGVRVYHSTCALMDSGNGITPEPTNFGRLVAGLTDEIVPDAWGGYMDAGDWDRRIQHLEASRLMLELVMLFPERYGDLELNIPESGNHLPDLIDEALFNLDCYRRMQTAEGGIRGGIESSEHPRFGEASWQESLTIMAYAPGVWSSTVYAGCAARAALGLQQIDADLSQTYRDSALRAMEWAEAERAEIDVESYPQDLGNDRNLAAAELYRLTGDERWHRLFLETTVFTDAGVPLYRWPDYDHSEAAWVYAMTDHDTVDPQVQANAREALLATASERAEYCQRTGFRWTDNPWKPKGIGSFTSPSARELVRAHHLTGDDDYLRAAVLSTQTGLGANPENLCYTTGLGQFTVRHPLHVDSRVTRQAPPPGITVLGPCDIEVYGDWAVDVISPAVHPVMEEWPIIETYWDVYLDPVVTEFTIHLPLAETTYVWGYLAAR